MRRVQGYRGMALGALLLMPVAASADRDGAGKGSERGSAPGASEGPAADNTKVNQRDRQTSEPTADQQRNNRSDLETTRLIRRALVKDKGLSMYAHNVKIIAQNGTVTLKGPVRSEDEKRAVEQKAADVAGAANIKNEIEIAPK